ncbi:ASCH domain-containing protein [Kitasatospora sp. NPDC057904]|uniref:ASCH domain-containing protein n=1 Tax=Kitasatospora sp. NPDC057904 TaxID=3346275 RepID=UPI0036DD31ED
MPVQERVIQIRRPYLNLIADGTKTIEVRVGYPSMRNGDVLLQGPGAATRGAGAQLLPLSLFSGPHPPPALSPPAHARAPRASPFALTPGPGLAARCRGHRRRAATAGHLNPPPDPSNPRLNSGLPEAATLVSLGRLTSPPTWTASGGVR